MFKLTDELAIVTTADIITPPVDDPFVFGQIAAANSISDVYAMGGKPVTCLNLVCFPSKKLPPEDLHQMVAGALDKITEAGAVLAGGHSIEDAEPKFGLAVTGTVHPENYWSNVGAKPGDHLILTKPVGSGVIFNAKLKKLVSDKAFQACVASVTTLNRSAAEILSEHDVSAATDVTGFGLAGHGLEMAGSDVCLAIDLSKVPVFPEAIEMYGKGFTTGVNKHNRAVVGDRITIEASAPSAREEILFDPQTSGGLLVAVSATDVDSILAELLDANLSSASLIGQVEAATGNGHLRIF